MKIARVFPTRTSMSPIDKDSYFGEPDLFTPEYDEIHISTTFTWDTKRAWELAWQWEYIAPVKIGGVAIHGEPTTKFVAGKYLCNGITITSRGCPFSCSWCLIKQKLIEFPTFPCGNNVQDNNLLACSKPHIEKVFQMLSKQSHVEFGGGLDCRLLKDWHIDKLRNLKIFQLWLAYDDTNRLKDFKLAVERLRKCFGINKVRSYVLIGFQDDTINKASERLREVYNIGSLPFAMLYRDLDGKYPQPEKKWRRFQRLWCRPAIIKSIMSQRE